MHTFRRTAAALLVGGIAVAGCSFSVGGNDEVPTSELEQQVGDGLADQMSIDSVSCPDPLPADAGSQVDCTLVSEGEEYTVVVTSEGKDGNKVKFSARVQP